MKKQLFPLFIGLLLMSFTAKDNAISLSEKDKENCTFFKTSINNNRLEVFEQLQSLVIIKTTKSNYAVNKQLFSNNFTTMTKVIEIFGLPNHKIGNKTFVYSLNPVKGCKAVFEFDNTNTVTYIGIKECN